MKSPLQLQRKKGSTKVRSHISYAWFVKITLTFLGVIGLAVNICVVWLFLQDSTVPSKWSTDIYNRNTNSNSILPLNANEKEAVIMDKERVRMIFEEAGVALNEEDFQVLPPWSQISQLFGDAPVLGGLDRCEAFRQAVPPLERMLGCAGMFNSGTNLVTLLLKNNCIVPERYEKYGPKATKEQWGIRWQVPWGKHTPAHYKAEHATQKAQDINKDFILPVVTIRDPYDWMKSMCKNSYECRWPHSRKVDDTTSNNNNRNGGKNSCPHLVHPQTKELVSVNVTIRETVVHKSLAHVWNSWYKEYEEDATYPFLMVRFEDLIFHTKETTKQICNCAGGILRPDRDFQYIVDSAKDGPGHGKVSERTGMIKAWIKFGQPKKIMAGFSKVDYIAAKEFLNDKLMENFRYFHPPPN